MLETIFGTVCLTVVLTPADAAPKTLAQNYYDGKSFPGQPAYTLLSGAVQNCYPGASPHKR